LQGDGKGGFVLINTIAPGIDFFPNAGAIGDFNGDGKMDVAVTVPGVPPDTTSAQPDGTVQVVSGTGNGTFGNPDSFGSGGPLPVNIKAVDLNGDGKLDLLVANAGNPDSDNLFSNFGAGSSVSFALNNGTGFGLPTTLLDGIGTSGSKSVFAVEAADFDGD